MRALWASTNTLQKEPQSILSAIFVPFFVIVFSRQAHPTRAVVMCLSWRCCVNNYLNGACVWALSFGAWGARLGPWPWLCCSRGVRYGDRVCGLTKSRLGFLVPLKAGVIFFYQSTRP